MILHVKQQQKKNNTRITKKKHNSATYGATETKWGSQQKWMRNHLPEGSPNQESSPTEQDKTVGNSPNKNRKTEEPKVEKVEKEEFLELMECNVYTGVREKISWEPMNNQP